MVFMCDVLALGMGLNFKCEESSFHPMFHCIMFRNMSKYVFKCFHMWINLLCFASRCSVSILQHRLKPLFWENHYEPNYLFLMSNVGNLSSRYSVVLMWVNSSSSLFILAGFFTQRNHTRRSYYNYLRNQVRWYLLLCFLFSSYWYSYLLLEHLLWKLQSYPLQLHQFLIPHRKALYQ